MNSIDLWMVATIAFLGSLGHCIGMCGGFVVAYSSTKIESGSHPLSQSGRHLLYNIGRVSSYVMMGFVFGAMGLMITASMPLHGILFLLAGVLMTLSGLAMFGWSKILLSLEYSMDKLPVFKKIFSHLIRQKTLPSFFLLGMLNGFFPCGFVYFFAAKAAASGDPLMGAAIMGVFGLATIPVLSLIGLSIGLLKTVAFRSTMNKIAAVAMLGYGALTFYWGLAYFIDLPL
jgi:sulfite exporter TauE/SafE